MTIKYFFSFFCLQSITSSLGAQDLPFKKIIDNNVIVSFPSSVDSFLTDTSFIYTSSAAGCEYVVSKLRSKVIDRSREEFENSMRSYSGTIDSLSKTLYYKKVFRDTIIGGTKGIWVMLDSAAPDVSVRKLYIFYTTKDSFTYTFYAKFLMGNDNLKADSHKAFYNSIYFNENYYETLPLTIHGLSTRQIPGRIIGIGLVLIIMSYLVYNAFTKRITI